MIGPTKSPADSSNVIPLVTHKQEARVDSRVIARELGIQPGNLLETIYKYQAEIEDFGLLPFKTEAVKIPGARGTKHQRYALLNEDQAYFVLALSRNTASVVKLKAKLVLALRRYRDGQQAGADYLPFYHALHDEVDAMADRARQAGSTAPNWCFHKNVNALINRTFGLESGQRQRWSAKQRLLVTSAQAVALEVLRLATAEGLDHHQAYDRAKRAVEQYAAGASVLIDGGGHG